MIITISPFQQAKTQILKYIPVLILLLGLYACETEFTPDNAQYVEEIVVEGYIEAGDQPTPPYVILTRSLPFFGELNNDTFDDIFVHGAAVTVTRQSDDQSVTLEEICWGELSDAERELVAAFLGVNTDSLNINLCIYTDPNLSMMGALGESYDLAIEVEDQILTATTTIPSLVPLNTLFFEPVPDVNNDTLKELIIELTDPADETNFYRYFTACNSEPLLPGLASVVDDKVFNGQTVEFPLPKAVSPSEEIDVNTYGYFLEGDTMTLKFTTIDQAHFDFWNTLEFNTANQGPFSSYTEISSNINGGLGIWGGYAGVYYERIVPFD